MNRHFWLIILFHTTSSNNLSSGTVTNVTTNVIHNLNLPCCSRRNNNITQHYVAQININVNNAKYRSTRTGERARYGYETEFAVISKKLSSSKREFRRRVSARTRRLVIRGGDSCGHKTTRPPTRRCRVVLIKSSLSFRPSRHAEKEVYPFWCPYILAIPFLPGIFPRPPSAPGPI